ncbi:hypothetical protein BT96DRAFT_943560 [Gymnopus androsaceus JB14]|uniref:Uncharacterized protein n=1 Tax=Gymnopus androsaceus JB14 TaxID=1447944 RepID=A0A6A4H997_9AGAR|nr:hypothetical protein BT96DRAFT_943560 [Gymnopus androsaceus JB14]
MTVELLARVALLHWSLGQHPDAEAKLFWLSVDRDIDEYRGSSGFKNPDTVAMWLSFWYLYNKDVKKYGDPTTTSVVLVSTSAVTDNQHTVISKWAKTMEPPAEKKSNKCPCMDDGEDNAARASSGVGGAGDSGGADSSDRTGSSGGPGGDPNKSLNGAVTE